MNHEFTNELINETSPYLLQHAHNPVNWKPWNEKSLAEAEASNKLILISIGYASCHWCHVMERESFEDTLVAQIMNDNFVNIKVDREERPDVDQVYMNAVQLMTGHGGWPLNVIALPDGRPVWGGTYFRKEQWMRSLEQIQKAYTDSPQRLVDYATQLEQGIKGIDVVNLNPNKPEFEPSFLTDIVDDWSEDFDKNWGGMKRAPKFMMPTNWQFFMRMAHQTDDLELMEQVDLTLTKMAYGGVYDQIGGGFSRYSVDKKWHVPHFEKMLYDNAQMVSLYSNASQVSNNNLYEQVVHETLEFVQRELTDSNGAFYSSLDADSNNTEGELEEGAYYVWTKEELQSILGDDYDFFSEYYNINDLGYWEKGNYVLIRDENNAHFRRKYELNKDQLTARIKSWKSKLLDIREKRNRPRLDDKVLTSWNALMLKGYIDAYRVFGNKEYLEIAIKNANFIYSRQMRPDGGLNHSFKDDKSTINGYLEDYATTIDAFLGLYRITLDKKWLNTSRNLLNYTFDHFYDDTSQMFYFTSDEDAALVTRNIEYRDNVIPASNSILAKCLFELSHYFDNEQYQNTATQMLNNMLPEIAQYPSAFSNWLDLMINYTQNYYEVAIVGQNVQGLHNELSRTYLPNILFIGSKEEDDLPLLKNRYVEGETYIYVCVNKACKLPVKTIEEALKLIEK
ncbi:MAG: thioredoxin domain-containing protein [Bacteroidia bacterium]|nr:thioredoxin domain-containing protein [Bacteroidia bacterium]MBT8270218.1 thioredoxin domain-containing protein [Bacteroidia bacterium]NNF82545.1 thioredoxin domain-containing protein [Flavobacteriaceae bacterium]NNK71069.1 thioredoxin domain-containing protein [Flavobacteriaceae bacterium]NNL78869.1 thioredoxin domain-containing protein [Flavobacteriaceae bacterium]